MRLLLIRHGQTPSNQINALDSAVPGPALTPLGQAQAAALVDTLREENIDAIFASTLTRAQQTAAPLATDRGITVRVRDGIREIYAGDLEMRSDRAAIDVYLVTMHAWADGDLERRMPGAETGLEVLDRFDRVVTEVAAATAGTAAVVSHGAVLRMWTAARAENIDADFVIENALSNTGVVVLEGDPVAGWRGLSWEGTDLTGAGDVVEPSVLAEIPGDGPAGETRAAAD